MPDCEICAMPLNYAVRTRVPCFSCPIIVCKECVRTFLSKTEQLPGCMGCKAAFTFTYLVRYLNRSWVNDVYRPWLKAVLLKRELTKMPESAAYAEAEMERRRLMRQNREFSEKIYALTAEIRKYKRAVTANRLRIDGVDPGRFRNDLVDGGAVAVDPRKKFVMKCPAPSCNGFLSTAYKCTICARSTCSTCLVVLAGGAEEHTCVESDRLSAELIKKETRPCPVCGERIFKISGCDQMWCTSVKEGAAGNVCGTLFSWKTGALEVGVRNHNPEYHEMMNRLGRVLPRTVGDVPCGGMPEVRDAVRALDRLPKTAEAAACRTRLYNTFRRLSEMLQYTVTTLRNRMLALDDSHKLRVPYLLNEMGREELGENLFRANRDKSRTLDEYNILEVLSNSGIDTYRAIVADVPSSHDVETLCAHDATFPQQMVANITKHLDALDAVRSYCNERLVIVSVTYTCSVTQYDEHFLPVNKKFKVREAEMAARATG
jgi:hypothetical protein